MGTAMARRDLPVFGLSLLDAITCGLGAVILLYMVINASVRLRSDQLTSDLRAAVDQRQDAVLAGHRRLVELRNDLRATSSDVVTARGLSRRLLEEIVAIRVELATYDGETISRRTHINRLKADLRSLEEGARRLSAAVASDDVPGDRIRSYIGDGDRQYLTGLKVGGQRTLFLVDASASMLDDDIVNIIRRRNLPDEDKIRAAKWQQAVATIDWLTTQLPRHGRFQIYTFSETVQPVIEGTAGDWLDGGDRQVLERAVAQLRMVVPGGGTNLFRALAAAADLQPRPDSITLLVDGLPTRGESPPRRRTVTPKQRLKLFTQAVARLPRAVPVNVILFPIEGDPLAASAYWKLAVASNGSFMSLSEDWP
jgi:Mg-chelatase subunit ChlD